MLQSWRWFGPEDPVTLAYVRQAGATDIVSALHDTYDGQSWDLAAIDARKKTIEQAGLTWRVVESIPVPQKIKLLGNKATHEIAAFKTTLRNLAKAGITTICYNFMPVIDWTRTDLRFVAPNGGLALRFDPIHFAAYDVFILQRTGAENSYDATTIAKAEAYFSQLSVPQRDQLEKNIIAGLPGSELHHTRNGILKAIAAFNEIDTDQLRANLIAFQKEIIPLAEEHGLRLCLHPDDPPFPLFGLPRVVSCLADYTALFDATPALANGVTFCVGSLGVRADNDLTAMITALAPRIHFAHLRNVTREVNGGFFEADHLEGTSDMVAVIDLLLKEEARRYQLGMADWQIPMRPDHGHILLDDRHKKTNPGYSAIGRLKGLAELRGVMTALAYKVNRTNTIN